MYSDIYLTGSFLIQYMAVGYSLPLFTLGVMYVDIIHISWCLKEELTWATHKKFCFISNNVISIPLKPYFIGFCWVYLTYHPSHRVLIHLKGLTVNIYIKP